MDFNANGKIDPVDIGILQTILKPEADASIELSGYSFSFVQRLIPILKPDGSPRIYMPQLLYQEKDKYSLHKYGNGPFCRFSISSEWNGVAGVYALIENFNILYIGQCADFGKRYNQGYGNISPRNCYVGGQTTNCKINALILEKYIEGSPLSLYFYPTSNYDRVERILISAFRPSYNGAVPPVISKNDTAHSKIHSPFSLIQIIWKRICNSSSEKSIKASKSSTNFTPPSEKLTNKEKIIRFLQTNRFAYCDDCLQSLCNISSRQAVFQICSYQISDQLIETKSACHRCNKYKKTRQLK